MTEVWTVYDSDFPDEGPWTFIDTDPDYHANEGTWEIWDLDYPDEGPWYYTDYDYNFMYLSDDVEEGGGEAHWDYHVIRGAYPEKEHKFVYPSDDVEEGEGEARWDYDVIRCTKGT